MIGRLPRFAELKLQSLCAEANALSHKTEEDERGWDFLVELPAKPFDGPPDMRPSSPDVYVQVKSTRNNRLACPIKLTNALLAAQSPHPWFVVLVRARPGGQTKLYAVHVWEAIMRNTLKDARRAHYEKRPLNQTHLIVHFSPADEKSGELIPWMQAEIDRVKPHYDEVKRSIYENAGFEEGRGSGVMTLHARNPQELRRNFLGLGDGLRVSSFTYTASRFGMEDPEPKIKDQDGTIHFTPSPSGEGELRFRTSATTETITLPAAIYSAPPGVPFEEKTFRFSAPCAEIVVTPSDPTCDTAEIHLSERQNLETLENYATLKAWFQDGPIELQIWSQAGRISVGNLRSQASRETGWKDIAAAFKLLRTIASPADQARIKMDLEDLPSVSGLKTFLDVSMASTVRIEFEPVDNSARGLHGLALLVQREFTR